LTREELDKVLEALVKRLSADGRLIEMGWVALRRIAVPHDAPPEQIHEMRMAYMAGAQHLFASMMGFLDPGEEPTDDDMKRIELIHNELEAFRKEMELRIARTEGRA